MSENEIRQITNSPPLECIGCEIATCFIVVSREANTVKRCPVYQEIHASRKIRRMLQYSRKDFITLPHWDQLSFNKNKISSQVEQIKAFPRGQNNLMMIIGPNGTGKTHCLLSLLFDILVSGKTAYYIDASTLHDLLVLQAKGELCGSEADELAEFIHAEYKLIDEIGGENESLFFEKQFGKLLNRYFDKFVMASNLDTEANNEKFRLKYQDNTLLSRLAKAVKVRWSGKDYRKNKSGG